jgi:hypothetical protein
MTVASAVFLLKGTKTKSCCFQYTCFATFWVPILSEVLRKQVVSASAILADIMKIFTEQN